ncbi:hypothetical protein JKP88DRAFT_147878, partial [Tribonema minus]
VIRIYRHLLKSARRLPKPAERADAFQQVREGFKAHMHESSQEKLAQLLNQAQSRLSYLKIVTPRDARNQEGAVKVVYQDGKLVEHVQTDRPRAPISNWTGSNMDPDSVSRHRHTLSRAGFKDHGHVLGEHGF